MGGALIETIFYCSSAASGWKRGKRVLDHMGNYNGTRLKTAMSNSIPVLVPTGHSSLTQPSARRISFLCTSEQFQMFPKSAISADSHVFAAGMRCYSAQAPLRLHEKCIALAQILSGSCPGSTLARDECR